MKPIVTAAVVMAAILAACGQAPAQGDAAQGAPRGPGRGAMLGMLDANKDGVVTKAEFDSSRVARFAALDTSKDGVLTGAEMTAGRPNGGRGGPMGDRMMMQVDANGDGKISKEEFAAGAALQWVRMDVNKDGKVDPTELAGLRGMRRGGGQGNNGG